MVNPVIIFGAKATGLLALEIFESNNIIVYGFLDDDAKMAGTDINGVPVLGNTDDERFLKLLGKKCEAFVAIDENKPRATIVDIIEEEYKVKPINAIHATACIAGSAILHHGTLFGPKVIIGPYTKIGNNCLLYPGCILESSAQVSDFVHIGAGSIIGSGVTIAEKAFVGPGVTIVAGISIGKNARIGAGSVVIENVPAGTTVFGNPAKKV